MLLIESSFAVALCCPVLFFLFLVSEGVAASCIQLPSLALSDTVLSGPHVEWRMIPVDLPCLTVNHSLLPSCSSRLVPAS